MLTIKDCLDYLDLTEEEVAEVAHHEHIPMICAIEECFELLSTKEGIQKIQDIILDNMVEAHENNMPDREKQCMLIYGRFVNKHH